MLNPQTLQPNREVFGSSPGTWRVYLWSLIRSTPALHRAFAAYLASKTSAPTQLDPLQLLAKSSEIGRSVDLTLGNCRARLKRHQSGPELDLSLVPLQKLDDGVLHQALDDLLIAKSSGEPN